MTPKPPIDKVRLDRWLWSARFYKTRSLAAAAVDGGKVHHRGVRVKRSQLVHVGDEIRIRKPPYEFLVEIRALSEHRGSAPDAQQLYRETAGSIAAREKLRDQMRHQPTAAYEGKGRPTKKDRRTIDRVRRGR